jgi:hypothetical protein
MAVANAGAKGINGAYSIGKCPGFSPGSLLSSSARKSTYAGAKVMEKMYSKQYFADGRTFAA